MIFKYKINFSMLFINNYKGIWYAIKADCMEFELYIIGFNILAIILFYFIIIKTVFIKINIIFKFKLGINHIL